MSEAAKARGISRATRDKIAAAKVGKPLSAEHRQAIAAGRSGPREYQRGRLRGKEAAGSYLNKNGYRILTGQYGHPLADSCHKVKEHRKVLYDKVGPGPHPCHWNCGRTELSWGGNTENSITADHLNALKLDNRPENLVVACPSCNTRRRNCGNPLEWTP